MKCDGLRNYLNRNFLIFSVRKQNYNLTSFTHFTDVNLVSKPPSNLPLHLFCSGGWFFVITIKAVLMWPLFPFFLSFFLFLTLLLFSSLSLRLVEPELVLSARHRGIFTFLVPPFQISPPPLVSMSVFFTGIDPFKVHSTRWSD